MNLSNWVSGKAEKSTYVKSITMVLCLLLGGIFLAIRFYQPPFSFLTIQISELSKTSDNPVGSPIFRVCFFIAGLFFIPHAFYLIQILDPDWKFLGKISGFFSVIAGCGLIWMAFFTPEAMYPLHVIGAISAIGGIAFSCFFSVPVVIKKVVRKASWPKIWQILLLYGEMIIIAIIALALVAIPIIQELKLGTFDPSNPPAIWPLCEWIILFASIIWACGIIYMSPKKE